MYKWTKLLKRVIPTPCYERPFVCDGTPDESVAIVIGMNPATVTDIDWWSFWSDKKGFNYGAFLGHYENTRSKNGKGSVSKTRLRLNRLRDNGIKCIETNAYKNEKPDGVIFGISNYAVLSTLLNNANNIKAIIAHGDDAHKFVDQANIKNDIRIFKTKHFIYVGYDEIDAICNETHAL